ncbi:hypothetical protein B0H11DRAFT_1148933 [Mycena galericulata]|nr:hypothetical protein B0H11DRAFT_1148933 [Mycena galericulata]
MAAVDVCSARTEHAPFLHRRGGGPSTLVHVALMANQYRYFGKRQPFGNKVYMNENMRFLTTTWLAPSRLSIGHGGDEWCGQKLGCTTAPSLHSSVSLFGSITQGRYFGAVASGVSPGDNRSNPNELHWMDHALSNSGSGGRLTQTLDSDGAVCNLSGPRLAV